MGHRIWVIKYGQNNMVKGSPAPSHFISETNVGKRRSQHRTTLNLNAVRFNQLRVDRDMIIQNPESFYVGSDSFRHWFQTFLVWTTLKIFIILVFVVQFGACGVDAKWFCFHHFLQNHLGYIWLYLMSVWLQAKQKQLLKNGKAASLINYWDYWSTFVRALYAPQQTTISQIHFR